jgi:hypothetical protein
MTSPFLDLLEQVASGISIFEPFYRTPDAMQEYQDLVHRLQEMERCGLIGRLWTEVRETAGVEHYISVMVIGGLTSEGERLLAQRQAQG